MKKTGCVILALIVVVCVSLFVNMLLVAALGISGTTTSASGIKTVKEKQFEEEIISDKGTSDKKIVVIPLEGIIASGQAGSLGDDMINDFKIALDQAKRDPEVAAVVIDINSPGGEITASDVLYHALQEFSKVKKSVVYFNSVGASGAYYTACGGSYIMCNSTTFTGSIGVIISTLNYRDLFGKIGLQSVVFKSGKFKDMLNGAREMTPEEKAYVDSLVMQSYGRFVGIVATARKLDEASLREGVADGRILSGTDALEAKLVDELGYVEDAYAKAIELGNSPGAKVVRYKRQFGLDKFLSMFGEAKTPSIKLDVMDKFVSPLEPGRIYLLPPFFAP